MKEILITNDDGYESEGLKKLVKMLKKEFKTKITIVSPASEKSACSHSITLTKPLRFVKVEKRFYKLDDGTPADCFYLTLHALYKTRLPDLVISGINKGANIGKILLTQKLAQELWKQFCKEIPAIALSQFYKKSKK